MKLKNKVAIALTLAFASVGAHAQEKGLDIGLGPARPAAPPAQVQQPAPAVNLQAIAAAPKAPAAVTPKAQPAPAPQAAPVRVPPVARPAVAAPVAIPVAAPVAVPATPAMATPSTISAAPVAAAPQQVQQPAPAGNVNPFTGRDLTAEQRQRQLEDAKLDTDIIQERLRQANLMADLAYLPLKKKAEVSTLPGMAVAAVSPTAKAGVVGESGGAVAEAPRKAPAKKKAPKKKVEPTAPVAPVAPPAPVITVSGISINGSQASAILEVDGGVMSVPNGGNTPYGQLRVIDSRTVSLAGKSYAVREAMLSRMAVSDPAESAADKSRAPVPVAAPAQAAAAAQQALANIPLPPLPPIPAPKGPAPTPGR